jgi:hypothetical protein
MTMESPFPELDQPAGDRAQRADSPGPAEGRSPLLFLAYLWLFCLVPLLAEREDGEVRWHARHGAILVVAELIAFFVWGFVGLLLAVAAPSALPHLLLTGPWAGLLVLWAHAVLAWEALHGRRLHVPGLSHWADRLERKRA